MINLVLEIIISSAFAALPTSDLKVKKCELNFLAKGSPAAIQIKGQSSSLDGDLHLVTKDAQCLLNGVLRLPLETLNTGIGLRDRHLKEKYLEVGKYKEAVLQFKNFDCSTFEKKKKLPFRAELGLHGVFKDIDGEFELGEVSDVLPIRANFKIKISDFKIEVPHFSGITVADEVFIETDINFGKINE